MLRIVFLVFALSAGCAATPPGGRTEKLNKNCTWDQERGRWMCPTKTKGWEHDSTHRLPRNYDPLGD